ncbi:MAG: carboxypeptidase-like regulatory domain-containing protein [Patescibacteria group bacterium]
MTAKHIIINDHGSITVNIPIDPEQASRRTSFLKRKVLRGKWLQDLVAVGAPISAIAMAFFLGRFWAVWILLGFYVMAIVFRFLDFKPPPPPFGTVRDADTNQPLEKVMVRIFEKKFGKLLEAQITSPKGRYAFVVQPGSYRLLVQKDGYKSVIINFPEVRQDHYLLAKDVIMHRRADD